MFLGKQLRNCFPLAAEIAAVLAHRTYAEDGLITRHTADFLNDQQFLAAYRKGKATRSWGPRMEPRWRVYMACSLARSAMSIPGDFAECGVHRGGMPLAIMEYLNFNSFDKRFYLLDTFAGIPERFAHADGHAYSDSYAEVMATFKPYPKARIIRGVVPDTLPQIDADRFSFLSIDMNSAEPEIAALNWFWPKLSPGAFVLLDDYAGSENYRQQKDAMDALGVTLGFEVISLPTGQGLIIR